MKSVDVYFKQFASECTCNATSLVAHEHDADCVALRDFYYVESKLHQAESLRTDLAAAKEQLEGARNKHAGSSFTEGMLREHEGMAKEIVRLREALEEAAKIYCACGAGRIARAAIGEKGGE